MPRDTQEPRNEDCIFVYRAVTFYGRPFQTVRLTLSYHVALTPAAFLDFHRKPPGELLWSYNPGLSLQIVRFGLFRVRSPLLSESLLMYLPPGTEMVHFPGFASAPYGFRNGFAMFPSRGFPHSEISGSQAACASPKHIAASYVLHRLIVPRHPHACP